MLTGLKDAFRYISKLFAEELAKTIIKIVFSAVGVALLVLLAKNIWAGFMFLIQKQVHFNILGTLFIFSLCFLFPFVIIERKKRMKKYFFIEYGDVSWKISRNPYARSGIIIEEKPYCTKCKVKYVVTRGAYASSSIHTCPLCYDKKQNLPIKVLCDAVENIAEASAEGHLNSKE